MGLYEACKTFDVSKGKTMRNYAIQRIVWMITIQLKKNSLNNMSGKSLKLLEKISLDATYSEEGMEVLEMHDILGLYDKGYEEIDREYSINVLKKTLPKNLFIIIEMRNEGYTYKEIGERLGVTSQRCFNMLKNYESIIRGIILENQT